MRRRLLAGFFLFALALIVALEVPLGLSLARNDRTTSMSEVQRDASSLAVLVAAGLNDSSRVSLQDVVSQFARADNAVVAVLSSGHSLAVAGNGAGEELNDARTKAIIRSAAAGHISCEEGSHDPDDDLLYVAQPVAVPGAAGSGSTASSKASDRAVLAALSYSESRSNEITPNALRANAAPTINTETATDLGPASPGTCMPSE
jgi:hypothetical protein